MTRKTYKKSIFVLCLGIFAFLLYPAPQAYAFFGERNNIEAVFNTGKLGFSIESESGASSQTFTETRDGNWQSVISKTGTLDFRYGVFVDNIAGDGGLCDRMRIVMVKNGQEIYRGSLSGSNVSALYNSSDTWDFRLIAPDTSFGESCSFSLAFKAWQDNFETYYQINGGFRDHKSINVTLSTPDAPVTNSISKSDVSVDSSSQLSDDLSQKDEGKFEVNSEETKVEDKSEESGEESSVGSDLSKIDVGNSGEINDNDISLDDKSTESTVESVQAVDNTHNSDIGVSWSKYGSKETKSERLPKSQTVTEPDLGLESGASEGDSENLIDERRIETSKGTNSENRDSGEKRGSSPLIVAEKT
ncbi:MAG: hypothetical protein COV70_01705 [Parcubacteria group bacterium CG11_big_fil_rev_8_21_14_0_20_39_22]|nr:MAG: hypothetical protein COV70_01705 [Parcubacteria group bacterium CG11_big_fil_rev_8_21_14_0_20_39_22]